MTGVPVHPGLFDEAADGTVSLRGARCHHCGRYHFPAADTCPYCSSRDVAPVAFSSTGTLWAWTTVHTAPPGYDGPVPFGFGVVELPEGVRVVTRLELDGVEEPRFGMPMRPGVAALGSSDDGGPVVTYTFTPA